MALSNETLERIISNLTPKEGEQLFKQLGRQLEQDKEGGTQPIHTTTISKPKQKKIQRDPLTDRVYCCIFCGSTKIKQHGLTSAGNQRFLCKDCGKTFTENHGDSLRYTHLSQDTWMELLRGFAI